MPTAHRLTEPRPLKRLGCEWRQAVAVITLARCQIDIAGGSARLDADRLYCLPPAVANELLAAGLAKPGEPTDTPV